MIDPSSERGLNEKPVMPATCEMRDSVIARAIN